MLVEYITSTGTPFLSGKSLLTFRSSVVFFSDCLYCLFLTHRLLYIYSNFCFTFYYLTLFIKVVLSFCLSYRNYIFLENFYLFLCTRSSFYPFPPFKCFLCVPVIRRGFSSHTVRLILTLIVSSMTVVSFLF